MYLFSVNQPLIHDKLQRHVPFCRLVAKSCTGLWDSLNCSLPVSSVQGISQARILWWLAISFSRGSSRPRDWNCISCRWILYRLATRKPTFHFKPMHFRGRATPHPKSGAAAERSSPKLKEQWQRGHKRAQRSYSTFKVRRGSHEGIPLVQGKEQWLRFAGATMKRYPKDTKDPLGPR